MTIYDTTFVPQQTTIAATWMQQANDLMYKGRNPLYVTSTASTNAYTITLPSGTIYTALVAGDSFTFKVNAANTGAATLTVVGSASVGPTAIKKAGGNALGVGDLAANAIVTVTYNGTNFELNNSVKHRVDIFNVKDYGAIGDNVTDDTTAIAACLTAAATATIVENSTTITKGAAVYFPAGVYVVSAALNIPARCYVYGDGKGGVLSSGTDSPGVSVIRGTHNGIILNCVTDQFTLDSLGICGPNNGAYTASVGIYTLTTTSPNAGAMNFTMQHIFVEKCYDGININGSYNGNLFDVFAQANLNAGIRAYGAQGHWNEVASYSNVSSGVVIDDSPNGNGTASPTINTFATYNNGGWGIVVADSLQGLTLNQFFINNDALGGITFDTKASLDQVISGSITNGQIQYCGVSSNATRSNVARGIYIGTNVGHVDVQAVDFYTSAGNHIEHHGSSLSVVGGYFTAAANGSSAIGGASYVAPTLPGNNFAIYGVTGNIKISNITSTDPIAFQGNNNIITSSAVTTDYAHTNGGGTSTQQVPVMEISAGSVYNALIGNIFTQTNTGSSASARGFVGNATSSYMLKGNQAFANNGASNTNSGTTLTGYGE